MTNTAPTPWSVVKTVEALDYYAIVDANGHAVAIGVLAADDAHRIVDTVNAQQQLVDALDTITVSATNGRVTIDELKKAHAALDAAKGSVAVRAPTVKEHLEWCKKRAYEYLDKGQSMLAITSMFSDLNKHPQTQNHPAIRIGAQMIVSGHMNNIESVRKYIEGFN